MNHYLATILLKKLKQSMKTKHENSPGIILTGCGMLESYGNP